MRKLRLLGLFLLLTVATPNTATAISGLVELPFGGKVESVTFCDCSMTFLIKYSPLHLGSIKPPKALDKVVSLVYSPFTTKLYDWGKSVKIPFLGLNFNYDPLVLTPGGWHLGKYDPTLAIGACVTGAPFCAPIPSLGMIIYMGTSKGLGNPAASLAR